MPLSFSWRPDSFWMGRPDYTDVQLVFAQLAVLIERRECAHGLERTTERLLIKSR